MITIWKYNLKGPVNKLEIPHNSDLLDIQNQGDNITVWFLVDTEAALETRTFHIYGTGHPIDNIENLDYYGTVQKNLFVWHIFEEIK